MLVWLKRAAALLVVALVVALFWVPLLAVVALISILVIALSVAHQWSRWRAIRRFRHAYCSQGKTLLLVYSNSPHWHLYVQEHWLPRWGSRAVVLNWSQRAEWLKSRRPEVALFRSFAGAREFNPLAIVVPPIGHRVHIIRFWKAFRDYKHGKDQTLRAAEAKLAAQMDRLAAEN